MVGLDPVLDLDSKPNCHAPALLQAAKKSPFHLRMFPVCSVCFPILGTDMHGVLAAIVFMLSAFGGGTAQAQSVEAAQFRLAKTMVDKMIGESVKFRSSLEGCVDKKLPTPVIACVKSLFSQYKPILEALDKEADAFFAVFKSIAKFPLATLTPIINSLAEIDIWNVVMSPCFDLRTTEEQSSCITDKWLNLKSGMIEQEQGGKTISIILQELAER